MNEITKEELRTPAQWAEKAGLIVNDYDGFLKAYEKLTGVKSAELGPSEYIMRRTTIIPEAILCSRQAFDRALEMCSLTRPRNMDYGEVSEVAPNFSESAICRRLYGATSLLEDIAKYGDVPSDSLYTKDELLIELQKSLESYEEAVENNKRLNHIQKERPLEEVKDSVYVDRNRIVKAAVKKGGTVEDLERKLIAKIKKSVEQVIAGKKEISTISINQIETLCAIHNVTERAERHRAVQIEDQCYQNPYYGKNDRAMKLETYRIIDENGAHNIVAGMQNDLIISAETDAATYRKAKAQSEKAKTSMRAVVVSAVEDCTQSDIDEARMIEEKELEDKEQNDHGNPGEGVL